MLDQYPRTLLIDAIALFALDNSARRLSRNTRQRYQWELARFAKWCEGESVAYLHELHATHLRTYAVHLNTLTTRKGKPLASATVHGWLRTLRRFLNFCVEEDLLEKSPFRNVKMPRLEKKALAALTPEEVQSVLHACESPRDKAIVAFIVDTGVRAEELCKLNISSMDFQSGAVLVEGKGQKQRIVFAGAIARKMVKRYLMERRRAPPDAPLFASLKATPGLRTASLGARLKPNSLVLLMRRLRERTGIAYLTAHGLRRTFAITCLRNGMDIFTLKELMGHADLTVLHRYLALARADLQRSHERHGPMDNL